MAKIERGGRTAAIVAGLRALKTGKGRTIKGRLAEELGVEPGSIGVRIAAASPVPVRWAGKGRGPTWDRSYFSLTVNGMRRDGRYPELRPIVDRVRFPLFQRPAGRGRYDIFIVVPADVAKGR